jgi:hypothetical protein
MDPQVFASETEEKVGLLNRAAPRSGPLIDWDPDIVETLDDDFRSHDVVLTFKDEDDGGEDELDLLLAEAVQVKRHPSHFFAPPLLRGTDAMILTIFSPKSLAKVLAFCVIALKK